jgi:hypothetical protein
MHVFTLLGQFYNLGNIINVEGLMKVNDHLDYTIPLIFTLVWIHAIEISLHLHI